MIKRKAKTLSLYFQECKYLDQYYCKHLNFHVRIILHLYFTCKDSQQYGTILLRTIESLVDRSVATTNEGTNHC